MGYKLNKALGQHFLRDEQVCRKIMDALKQHPMKQLLEVGPGGGALTRHLIGLEGVDLKCVEVDQEKVDWLLQHYPALQGKIIWASFLDMDRPFEGLFTVVGNFPYNISTQILFKVLDWKEQVTGVLGMFQKEVAQRIAAREGNKTYGVISVLIQAYYDVEYLFEVSEQCFNPPPKVKSAVIRLTRRAETVPSRSDTDLSRLVKAAFNQRRKTLRNALKSLFDAETLKDPLFDKRAEQLSVATFGALTFRMKSDQHAPS